MSKVKTNFTCNGCGNVTPRWSGRCSACGEWNLIVESAVEPVAKNGALNRYSGWSGVIEAKPVLLGEISAEEYPRSSTGLPELDRVLGGGVVPGSVTLLGGDPGVGKSTMLMQVSAEQSRRASVVYVSGEESPAQLALRAKRLNIMTAAISIYPETALEKIISHMQAVRPAFMVIDSIQTIYSNQLTSAPGSVAQVKECAAQLNKVAKSLNISLFLVGHVTKDGTLAGPRVLEHIVDSVLYFEGEEGSAFRMIRAIKNRFGAVNELGVFAMGPNGLEEVSNPSSLFLTAHEAPVPGVCILAALEGNRPFLVEAQALVEESISPNPRRFSAGIETNRLQMLLAVLNKHANIESFDKNVYVKIVGGVRLTEPAADLPVLMAVLSSITRVPLERDLIMFGEVGLAGEVRPVADAAIRLKEAANLGYKKAIVPLGCRSSALEQVKGIELLFVSRVEQAVSILRRAA